MSEHAAEGRPGKPAAMGPPRGRRPAAALVAAAILVWSVADRQAKLDKIPVAIVNNDKILTDPQPMAAGRALTASLTDPKPGTPSSTGP